LERITMVLQNKKNTFEIDLWEPVIKLLENYCQKNIDEHVPSH
jgi:alanyl-tRNA synthetase